MKKAGKNEKKVIKYLKNKYKLSFLGKKKFYSDDKFIEISVDESFDLPQKKCLLEIDSYNMAKVLIGQFTLLNLLIPDNEKNNYIFIVIHMYKKYNIDRTLKYLNFLKSKLFNNKIIEYKIIHYKELQGIDFLSFIND